MSNATDDCEQVSASCPVEDTIYGYTPNLGGNLFYTIVFAFCAVADVYLMFRHWRSWKGYTILVLLGAVGECCGYVGRVLLNNNPWDGAAMTIQMLLLMVSPSFLAAALYMTLRTLVQYFGPEHTKLPARLWTWPFVTADLVGFVSQCGGGIVASMGGDGNAGLATAGNSIMVAGVSFQAIVMIIAGVLAVDFTVRMRRRQSGPTFRRLPKDLKIFLSSMISAFLLILARCIYRIPELAGGVGGPLMRIEVDFMIFDGCLIMVSVVILSAAHPGLYANALQDSQVWTYKTASPSSDLEHRYEMRTNPDHAQDQQCSS